MLKFSGLACASDLRSIRHLDHIRHMAGGGGVENRQVHAVPGQVQHLGHHHPGLVGDGFARLQIHLDIVLGSERLDTGNQVVHLVIGAGDVVAAAEVDPLHPVQQVAKFLLHDIQGAFKRREVLLTQGVEMNASYFFKTGGFEL